MTSVRFEQSCNLLFLSFNDLNDLEVVLEGLSSHWMIVVDTCSTRSKERKVSLTTANVDRSSEVESIRVTNGSSQFVDTDRFNLCWILFAVSVSRSEFKVNVLVDLSF